VHCDAVIVGLGPGGEEVAGKLAEAGLNVIGVEAELVGGECPYWGCIPSKMMVRAADLLAEGRRIPGMAGSSVITSDWAPVAQRIREEATDSWDDKVAVDRFVAKGGHFIRGRARVTSTNSVEVDGGEIVAKTALVLATGAHAWVPPQFSDIPHWTNREAIATETVPASLLVIGGGSIGLEIGQVMSRFGAKVTIVETGDRIAGAEEPEVSDLLTRILRREGIDVHTGVQVVSASSSLSTGCTIRLGDGSSLSAERVLVATGRRSDLPGLGVAAMGLDDTMPTIPVDTTMRVMPGVWAVGDITGKGAFTHVAMYQARICVADILGHAVAEADYRALPRVTFTDPEIGAVGMTETEARKSGGQVRVMSEPIAESARGWIHKGEGLIKLIEVDGVLAGATSMGPTGGEVLGLLTLAVHARIPVSTLRDMIYAYPTFYQAIDSALRA
jgi:pyruvate/2-oxoglutarate dehydrogenase complex dihydrolipoamide dehydrogenase (E3) component